MTFTQLLVVGAVLGVVMMLVGWLLVSRQRTISLVSTSGLRRGDLLYLPGGVHATITSVDGPHTVTVRRVWHGRRR